MDDFGKALGMAAADLKTLSGDIARIMAKKKKQLEEELKKQEGSAQEKKEDAKESFNKIPLKSLQPVTKLYKDKKEIEDANENPEEDFIRKKLEDIFKNI